MNRTQEAAAKHLKLSGYTVIEAVDSNDVIAECDNCGRHYQRNLTNLSRVVARNHTFGCVRCFYENVASARRKHLTLSNGDRLRFRTLIDGLLLGDAHISRDGQLVIGQAVDKKGWIDQIGFTLADLDVEFTVKSHRSLQKSYFVTRDRVYKCKPIIRLSTSVYQEIVDERRRWYPKGKKRIPEDVDLSAKSVAHWFAGDGCGDINGRLKFCTQGFPRRDVNMLQSRFRDSDIHTNIADSRGPELHIMRLNDAYRVAQAIRPHLPYCMLYKLRYTRPSTHHLALGKTS